MFLCGWIFYPHNAPTKIHNKGVRISKQAIPEQVGDSAPATLALTRAEQPLDKLPALLWVARLWSLLLGLLAALAVLVPLLIWAPLLWAALALPLLPLSAWAAWRYAARFFEAYQARWLPKEGVVLNKGVWWRSEVWVPMARLQHLDVSQGPLDRRWGMASLSLHTAGTHDHKTRIHGLPQAQAHALREALLPRLNNKAPEHD